MWAVLIKSHSSLDLTFTFACVKLFMPCSLLAPLPWLPHSELGFDDWVKNWEGLGLANVTSSLHLMKTLVVALARVPLFANRSVAPRHPLVWECQRGLSCVLPTNCLGLLFLGLSRAFRSPSALTGIETSPGQCLRPSKKSLLISTKHILCLDLWGTGLTSAQTLSCP